MSQYALLVLIKVQGDIGVLDRKDMDSFASIFINYQKVGVCNDPEGGYALFVDGSFFKAFLSLQKRLVC
jgi:hypothetical protein